MEPKLMNCCKPEQVGTKEYDKMLKRIPVLEHSECKREESREMRIRSS